MAVLSSRAHERRSREKNKNQLLPPQSLYATQGIQMTGSFSRVINRSSVWPLICVSTVTCCLRPMDVSKFENTRASTSLATSIWKLKSPGNISGSGDKITDSRFELNSSKNTRGVTECAWDYGGRQMMISLALNDVYVTLHSENSNEVLSPESIFFTSMLTT